MRQAQTLNEAQLRRVIQYCRSRRHPTRDETIVLFSFYAGLRAKESYCQIWCLRVLGHAAIWSGFVASIPSLNLTPVMTLAR